MTRHPYWVPDAGSNPPPYREFYLRDKRDGSRTKVGYFDPDMGVSEVHIAVASATVLKDVFPKGPMWSSGLCSIMGTRNWPDGKRGWSPRPMPRKETRPMCDVCARKLGPLVDALKPYLRAGVDVTYQETDTECEQIILQQRAPGTFALETLVLLADGDPTGTYFHWDHEPSEPKAREESDIEFLQRLIETGPNGAQDRDRLSKFYQRLEE
uniref:Uncharacterized protein n=1 Tax=Caulobacter phage BL57 TaxID=3348355 RepID=A0AB74UMA6_9VIRU